MYIKRPPYIPVCNPTLLYPEPHLYEFCNDRNCFSYISLEYLVIINVTIILFILEKIILLWSLTKNEIIHMHSIMGKLSIENESNASVH